MHSLLISEADVIFGRPLITININFISNSHTPPPQCNSDFNPLHERHLPVCAKLHVGHRKAIWLRLRSRQSTKSTAGFFPAVGIEKPACATASAIHHGPHRFFQEKKNEKYGSTTAAVTADTLKTTAMHTQENKKSSAPCRHKTCTSHKSAYYNEIHSERPTIHLIAHGQDVLEIHAHNWSMLSVHRRQSRVSSRWMNYKLGPFWAYYAFMKRRAAGAEIQRGTTGGVRVHNSRFESFYLQQCGEHLLGRRRSSTWPYPTTTAHTLHHGTATSSDWSSDPIRVPITRITTSFMTGAVFLCNEFTLITIGNNQPVFAFRSCVFLAGLTLVTNRSRIDHEFSLFSARKIWKKNHPIRERKPGPKSNGPRPRIPLCGEHSQWSTINPSSTIDDRKIERSTINDRSRARKSPSSDR